MGKLTKSQAPRVHWHPEHGWLVDTVFPMTAQQLKVCIDFTLKVQTKRIAGMMPGYVRDEAVAALHKLNVGTLKQVLQSKSPWERDKIAFMGDGNEKSDRVISLGAH